MTDTAKARFVIRSPVVEGDSVRGFTGGVERRIPLAAVDRVAVRRFNPLKTAWWFVLAPIGALAAVVGVGCAFDPCNFSMSY